MLRIAICDDDSTICSSIEAMILEYGKTSYVQIEIDAFNTGEDLLKCIKNNYQFDLIFLDIELGTTTGIHIGKTIREEFDDHISKIVFITSKNGYEAELFDVQPLYFLRKPIDKQSLKKSLDLGIKLLDIENIFFKYNKGRDIIKVKIKDIIYFEKSLRKICIVTTHGEDFFNDSISNIQRRITKNFILPHESFLLNYHKVRSFNSQYIIMIDGKKIPISRGRLPEIRTMLLNDIREK